MRNLDNSLILPGKNLLVLDTATPRAAVAVLREGQLVAEGSREVTTHSEGLMPLIDALLGQAELTPRQLDAVICGSGPGSFTGLRIGMATAKGLCLAASIPLFTGSSLQALARAAGPDELVAAVLDARRKEVFVGLFDGGRPVMEETVCAPESVAGLLADRAAGRSLVLAGDGALAYRELLLTSLGSRAVLAPEGRHEIEARCLAEIVMPRILSGEAEDLGAVVPLYIRSSDAKLPAVVQDKRPSL